MPARILILNPGSTSTKIAVFQDEKQVLAETIQHTNEINNFNWVMEQVNYRRELIVHALKENMFCMTTLTAICARGGMIPLCPAGAFEINKTMVDYIYSVKKAAHVANIGCVIAYDMAEALNIPAYIYDPVSVDELQPVARISGMPELRRVCRGHALNTRAMARKCAQERLGKHFSECTFIVVHLGSGTSVRLIKNGITIDANSDDDGCISLERSGNVAAVPLIQLCFSGQYTEAEMLNKIRGNGGLKAYLGTSNLCKIETIIKNGDDNAKLYYEALAYTTAKDVGAMAAVVAGDIDRIILTGGAANSKMLTDLISKRISFIAPVELMPGEFEMQAMAAGTLRVLNGEEKAHCFTL
ncbi:butyrate kinase|uniref:Probable butyrate kinase n=1 Tax=Dendrosporobacter quercicolus TaxID=146817 RepID=A0A1G9QKL2_9FIRM|nr:butyrate kinase [Dendrosporobacter quercicolus]NSL48277.1 butyrate kinase [Dendrosporobacter quercicolus DSM 1736]SDM11542.1 butyrate kinase [Dendrosporobacter quercicolus]